MKMFVFPRENEAISLELEEKRPFLNSAIDVAVVRFCTFLLAWAAGASMAIILAVAS